MDFYLDLELLPDPEISVDQIRSALFAKLHLVFVESKSHAVGCSFPKFGEGGQLGSLLRLHGSKSAIDAVISHKGFASVRDYATVGDVQPVPAETKHRTVRRVQSKSNAERLRRRLRKRHNLSEMEARERIPDSRTRLLKLPFVCMRSGSTRQQFRLFLDHGPVVEKAVAGSFNSYGLSAEATIPWF